MACMDISQRGDDFVEVIMGDKCSSDLSKHQHHPSIAEFPRRGDLPRTQNLWLGHIIENLWTESYDDLP